MAASTIAAPAYAASGPGGGGDGGGGGGAVSFPVVGRQILGPVLRRCVRRRGGVHSAPGVTGSDRLVVAAAPVATLGSGSKVALNTADFKSSTLPVTLTWSATDANTIASYQLQQQVKP